MREECPLWPLRVHGGVLGDLFKLEGCGREEQSRDTEGLSSATPSPGRGLWGGAFALSKNLLGEVTPFHYP